LCECGARQSLTLRRRIIGADVVNAHLIFRAVVVGEAATSDRCVDATVCRVAGVCGADIAVVTTDRAATAANSASADFVFCASIEIVAELTLVGRLSFADTTNANAEKALIVKIRAINRSVDACSAHTGVDCAGIAVIATDRAASAVGGVCLKIGIDDIAVRLVSRNRTRADRDKDDRIRRRPGKVTDADLVGGIGCLFCDAPGEDCSNAAGKSLQDIAS